jgi:glutamate-1-semialdehyde 2,1-aminomutase
MAINDFKKSNDLLGKALEVIPTASQTFSKSYLQYPRGASPLFISRAQNATVVDIDGNEFIDLVNGLMAIVLGHNYPAINDAIASQLANGISFSLPSTLEYQLAHKLTDIIPCAEMVRFGKTGTDVTSAAIRISRAYTRREKILVCGYHGWQDWYIGSTTRDLGVPASVKDLTEAVPYNDLQRLEELLKTESFAAFIMEPTNVHAPKRNYLSSVRELTQKYGTLLIFDEMITGFHYDLGGAQKYFDVTPDLACFGKGMGNGMPISAIVGSKPVMSLMKDIFFSGTFGGEALSLAAALAVIDTIEREDVVQHMWRMGARISDHVTRCINENNLEEVVSISGYDPWTVMQFMDIEQYNSNQLRTFFQQNMIQQGVLIMQSNNISYAIRDDEYNIIANAYSDTFNKMSHYIQGARLDSELLSPVIEPVFKVR